MIAHRLVPLSRSRSWSRWRRRPACLKLSDCDDDPAEGAASNQITQSFRRFGQREGFSHDRFDRAGLKQRHDRVPGVSQCGLRLSKQYEALNAGPLPDLICNVDGCLAACRMP